MRPNRALILSNGGRRTELKTKRSSLNAYILFKSEESATAALAACVGWMCGCCLNHCSNGTVFEERHLRVDAAAAGEAHFDPKRTVFVGNVPFGACARHSRHSVTAADVNEEELYKFFGECGVVKGVRVIRNKVRVRHNLSIPVTGASKRRLVSALRMCCSTSATRPSWRSDSAASSCVTACAPCPCWHRLDNRSRSSVFRAYRRRCSKPPPRDAPRRPRRAGTAGESLTENHADVGAAHA